jgi:D-alanyl-D-alanine carboxypeptidase (penicillin-binding protein 5/6)
MTEEGLNQNKEYEAGKSNDVVGLKMDRNWELLKRKCRTKMRSGDLNDPLSDRLKGGAVNILFYGLAFMLIFLVFLSSAFAETIHSRAAVVVDVSTGRILYAKHPERRLPPASTTKLMTAIVAIEKADLHDVVTISRNASLVRSLKAGFKQGDKVTVEKLLYAALIKSANDAAVALAEAVAGSEKHFVDLMNQRAISIGAKNTKFINSTGLPGPHQYTTALDLSKIMSCVLSYPKLKEIIATPAVELSTDRGEILSLKNTDKLLWSHEDLIGGKTGYTFRAGHCFVCAAEREKEVIIVALLGSPSRGHLWKETEALIDQGFQILANKKRLQDRRIQNGGQNRERSGSFGKYSIHRRNRSGDPYI